MELVIIQAALLLIAIVGMIVTIKLAKRAKSSHSNIERLLKTKEYGQLQGIVGSIDEMIGSLEYRFKAMRNYWEHHSGDKTRPLGSTEPTEEELISTEIMKYQPLLKVAKTFKGPSNISKWLEKEYPDTYKQLIAAIERVEK